MKLQQGHGGWNPRMTEYLTKVGTVHRITDKGDIRLERNYISNDERKLNNIFILFQSAIRRLCEQMDISSSGSC